MKALLVLVFVLFLPGICRGSEIEWATVDGGGVTFASGGGYRMAGTIGQPDAGTSTGPGLILVGGFWAILESGVVVPTPSSTTSPSPRSTPTPTRSFTAGATPTGATGTPTLPVPHTPTPTTAIPTGSPSPSVTATPTATPTPTGTPEPRCIGDCDGDERVAVSELVTIVGIALGSMSVELCEACDANHDRLISIDEAVSAVDHALHGCPSPEDENGPGPAALDREGRGSRQPSERENEETSHEP